MIAFIEKMYYLLTEAFSSYDKNNLSGIKKNLLATKQFFFVASRNSVG